MTSTNLLLKTSEASNVSSTHDAYNAELKGCSRKGSPSHSKKHYDLIGSINQGKAGIIVKSAIRHCISFDFKACDTSSNRRSRSQRADFVSPDASDRSCGV